ILLAPGLAPAFSRRAVVRGVEGERAQGGVGGAFLFGAPLLWFSAAPHRVPGAQEQIERLARREITAEHARARVVGVARIEGGNEKVEQLGCTVIRRCNFASHVQIGQTSRERLIDSSFGRGRLDAAAVGNGLQCSLSSFDLSVRTCTS
ncbi:MAG: hypothetical protein V3T86_06025, partial [Planctomycetota bacterium]